MNISAEAAKERFSLILFVPKFKTTNNCNSTFKQNLWNEQYLWEILFLVKMQLKNDFGILPTFQEHQFQGSPFCGCSRFQIICLRFYRVLFKGIHAVLKGWSFNLVFLVLYLLLFRILEDATKWKSTHLSNGYKQLF